MIKIRFSVYNTKESGENIFMSKKKKKKNSVVFTAKENMKILKNGKVKFAKNQKISLDPFIKDSLDGVIVSRVEGIISKEDVVIDVADLRCDINSNLSSVERCMNLVSKANETETFTVVNVIHKKNSLEIFDFLDDTIMGTLLRTSTLASIYKKVKDSWKELNEDDNTNFTNVLYVPKVFIFLNADGSVRKVPFTVNLLLVAVPDKKQITNNAKDAETLEYSEEEAIKSYITDVRESAIRVGAKRLIIDPFCLKEFIKNEREASEKWYAIFQEQRAIQQIKSIDFAVNDDDLYIIFTHAK